MMGRPRTPIRVAHRAGLTSLTNIAPAGSGGRLMQEGWRGAFPPPTACSLACLLCPDPALRIGPPLQGRRGG